MFRSDAATASLLTQLVVMQISASLGFRLDSIDVKGAYLSGDKMDRQVILHQPVGGLPGVPRGRLLRCNVGCYGISDAARRWWLSLRKKALSCGFVQSKHEPSLFMLY